MSRWFNRRWAWAALAGAGLTIGVAAGRADDPPKVGAVLTLNIDGKGDREFKVVKSEKQPDGSYLSELKDTKSGETITLLDKPGEGTPPPAPAKAPPAAPKAPPAATPKAQTPAAPKPQESPKVPDAKAKVMPDAAKDKEKEKEKERRPLLSRIFDRDKDKEKEKSPSAAEPPKAEPNDGRKGVIGRIFGSKKPAPPPANPSMPAGAATGAPKPTASASPPAVLPVPPGGLTGTPQPAPAKPVTTPQPAPPMPLPASTAEPPRVSPPGKPPAPPAAPEVNLPGSAPPAVSVPAIPMPMPPGVSSPPPAPAPASIPGIPAPLPSVPSIPAPPAGGGLPPIPVPPNGTSSVQPAQSVVPAGYAPAQATAGRGAESWVVALQTMTAPSARLTAAKALADCRDRSTDAVKVALFQAAKSDPCGEVRAACIGHLCELGYFDPQFLVLIESARADSDPYVRDAATAACAKMLRK